MCRGSVVVDVGRTEKKWSRCGVVDIWRGLVRVCDGMTFQSSFLYGNLELGLGTIGTWNWVLVKLGAIATCVQTLVSARGSVERSAPPVRVHNLSKTWLRRLPGAAAGAAPGPLDRLQGQGVSRGGFQGCGLGRAIHGSDEIRTEEL